MAKKDRLSSLNIDDLLAEVGQTLDSLKKKRCKVCKKDKQLVDGVCEDCRNERAARRQAKLDNARHTDGKYIRINRDGKLVYEHKWLVEQQIGRPLNEREVVIHLDGNTLNNDLSNLALSLKGGTPFSWLVCTNCSCRGAITVENPDAS